MMKEYMKNHLLQGALRTIACLFLFSATVGVFAQSESEKASSADAKKQAPQYEMREVSGHVYDAATNKPLAGVNVRALNNRQYTAMTNEDGAYTL